MHPMLGREEQERERHREIRGGYCLAVVLVLFVAALLATGGIRGAEPGFTFAFHNSTEQVWNYWLYQVADKQVHDGYVYHPGIGKWVTHINGGEVRPAKTVESPEKRPPGDYIIGWRVRGSNLPAIWHRFTVKPGTTLVLLTPEGMRAYLGA